MNKHLLLTLAALFALFIPLHASKDIIPRSEQKDAKYTINLHFAKQAWSANADTLFLRFRITDNFTHKKVFWSDLTPENFEIREDSGNPPDKGIIVERIVQQAGALSDRISQNAAFWFLVDRGKTISPEDMESMREAIRQTVENLPDSCAYICFFDKNITEVKLITKNNFFQFEREFVVKPDNRDLYQSIIKVFERFAIDQTMEKDAKCLLVFTDGKINLSSIEEIDKLDQSEEYFRHIDNTYENIVQIHAFRYGMENSLADKVLNDLCLHRQNPALIGGFYPARNVSGIVDSLRGFVNNLSSDYELMLVNNLDKIYNGGKLTLQVILSMGFDKAVGEIQYAIASKEKPLGPGIKSDDTYIAIIFGLFILFIAFFIMQVVIPYFISKTSNFEKKYVKPYEPMRTEDGEVYEVCSFCQEPLERGDQIVTKCSHKIHWDCWKENGYKCVEYGQNCKDGIQYHYDSKHPFDLKKSPYYMKWAMAGMISGFFIWIIFRMSSKLTLFKSFIDKLLETFYPQKFMTSIDGVEQIPSDACATFHSKIAGLLLVGVLLGFILTFLFSYLNDFRKKNARVVFSYTFRSLIGALVGFVTFLAGSILCISLGKFNNVAWLDAIPWMLFGGFVALTLSIKTTIKWQDALIGGLISGILSFIILYSTYFFPSFGVLFSFMLCSGGLGISIIARHTLAQKYFLKYKSAKREGSIAIHKWMNDSGGSNEVTIGKSNHCVVQMNWDESDNIAPMQVKLYIDPKRRVPMLKVVEGGMIYDGRDGRRDEFYQLRHNVKFKIGNTDFQYIEK